MIGGKADMRAWAVMGFVLMVGFHRNSGLPALLHHTEHIARCNPGSLDLDSSYSHQGQCLAQFVCSSEAG